MRAYFLEKLKGSAQQRRALTARLSLLLLTHTHCHCHGSQNAKLSAHSAALCPDVPRCEMCYAVHSCCAVAPHPHTRRRMTHIVSYTASTCIVYDYSFLMFILIVYPSPHSQHSQPQLLRHHRAPRRSPYVQPSPSQTDSPPPSTPTPHRQKQVVPPCLLILTQAHTTTIEQHATRKTTTVRSAMRTDFNFDFIFFLVIYK